VAAAVPFFPFFLEANMSDMQRLSPEEQDEASRDDRDRYEPWSESGRSAEDTSSSAASEVGPPDAFSMDSDRWRFNVDSSLMREVWFSVYAGPMSGGHFMTARDARKLGEALIAHANHAEAV
jgi:hypothetical protein